MVKVCVKQKKSPLACCGYGCLVTVLLGVLWIVVTYQISIRIAENTIFLTTENITLVNTYHCRFGDYDAFIQNDLRISSYVEKINNTSVISNFLGPSIGNNEIFLKENDDYLVLVETSRHNGVKIGIRDKFWKESYFSFYRIQKDTVDGRLQIVKTEFLGSIHTNLYGAWRGNTKEISICSDGKYIVMSARAVDSRSLGEFRKKDVLLIWEIGDNVVEKDIVDRKGRKFPIIIKTDEELEKE
jgi:hypothetical protein